MRPSALLELRNPIAALTIDAAAWAAGEDRDREEGEALIKAGVGISPFRR